MRHHFVERAEDAVADADTRDGALATDDDSSG
jgi:hypothetical protein